MNQVVPKDKKIYFVSDVHLGLPPLNKSLEREKLLVKWLEEIRKDAFEIYLLGDIFDYWFEYKKVVPRGFVRFLGKIAEIRDSGIPIYFFTGNHDVWIFDYLPEELGIEVYRNPIKRIFNGKKFYLAHGDGLGPGEKSYKLLKSIFTSRVLQWLFARLHPNTATGFAHRWSKQSRFSKGNYVPWLGEEKEHLVLHSKKILETEEMNFFIYGHRHVPKEFSINEKSKLIYLGDWFVNFTYAVFDGEDVRVFKYGG
ncbi:MAG: UDP-2,3-diacylglucosamine diphosphatase [Bacteroidales bacterium]|nr:UDP-2,3-diacylglucosamine diphosphatase [Bacteroidales bacterium]MCF8390880.1 UDP-2,3-diacylglucosamine diphosphatase [Bacteroidales bacterium]